MRENLRHNQLIMDNKAFGTSLFNLVTTDAVTEADIKREGFISTNQNKLARFLIELARPITRRIAGLERISLSRPQMGQGTMGSVSMSRIAQPEEGFEVLTSFEIAENELEVDFLSVLLGSINALGELSSFDNDILKTLDTDIINNLVKGLPRIR